MSEASVIARLIAGETIFVPGGTNDGGAATETTHGVGQWYAKVKAHGKFLHTRKVTGGVEMWADDEPLRRGGMAARRRYTYEGSAS